tara:strand:+ start:18889 stop:21234 length:2346 start_codon:yes stop_codon:yes gene_type:complete
MATFSEQVASLAGTLGSYFTADTNDKLNQALEDGTKDVIRRVTTSNPEDVWLFTTSSSVTSSGLDLDSSKIYDVSRGSKPCNNIPINLRYRAKETDSIYYATSEFPVYYLLDSKLFVLPEPGAGSDKTISAFTTYDSGNKTKITATAHGFNEQDQVIIAQSDSVNNDTKYVGGHYIFDVIDVDNFIIAQDFDSDEGVTGYSVSEPTALCQHLAYPTVTASSTDVANFPQQYYSAMVTYGATVVIARKMSELHTSLPELTMPVGPVAPILKTHNDDVPQYEGPASLVLPPIPSSTDVDFSGITAPTFIVTAKTTIPDLSFDISSITIADLDLGLELPAPPLAPSFSSNAIDMTTPRSNAPAYSKPTFTAPTFPTLDSIILPVPPAEVDLGTWSDGQTNQAGSNQPIYTVPVLIAPEWSSVDTSITDEDVEIANVKLQKIQSQLAQYQAELTNASTDFSKEMEVYRKRCDEAMANSGNTLTKEQQEKQAILAKHSSAINIYQAEVQAEMQKWEKDNLQIRYTRWTVEYQNKLQEYQQDIGNEVNEFNKEVQIYQAELAKATGDATNNQNKETQEYQAVLSKYQAEVTAYQAKTSHNVAEWQQKIVQVAMTEFQQKRQDSFQEWTTRVNANIQKYSAEVQAENNKFQSELAVYQQETQRQLSAFQAETGYDLSIYQNEVNGITGLFQAELSKADAKFKNEIDSYIKKSGEVRAENQEVSADFAGKMQHWTTESSNETSSFTTKIQSYGQEYNWYLQKLDYLTKKYDSMFIMSSEAIKQQQEGVR